VSLKTDLYNSGSQSGDQGLTVGHEKPNSLIFDIYNNLPFAAWNHVRGAEG